MSTREHVIEKYLPTMERYSVPITGNIVKYMPSTSKMTSTIYQQNYVTKKQGLLVALVYSSRTLFHRTVMSCLPLLPFVFIVIVYVLFRVKYFFQASEKTVVIFASRLGTLEKLKSQEGRVSDSV